MDERSAKYAWRQRHRRAGQERLRRGEHQPSAGTELRRLEGVGIPSPDTRLQRGNTLSARQRGEVLSQRRPHRCLGRFVRRAPGCIARRQRWREVSRRQRWRQPEFLQPGALRGRLLRPDRPEQAREDLRSPLRAGSVASGDTGGRTDSATQGSGQDGQPCHLRDQRLPAVPDRSRRQGHARTDGAEPTPGRCAQGGRCQGDVRGGQGRRPWRGHARAGCAAQSPGAGVLRQAPQDYSD